MIIEKIVAKYRELGSGLSTGDPLRLSRAGSCVKQSIYMKFAHLYPPEPLQARAMLVFEEGTRTHDWLKRELRTLMNGKWGMEEEALFIEVDGHRIYGHIDGLVDIEDYGLTVAEIKSMSNAMFRRALEGKLDHGYVAQLNAYIVAAGLDSGLFICYRKETSHLMDIFISKHLSEGLIIVTLTNGRVEFRRLNEVIDYSEEAIESVEVRLPFSEELRDEIIDNFRTVIYSKSPDDIERPLEYDQEDFRCRKCDGEGFYLTEKRKTRKPCGYCEGTGTLGSRELRFPCSYCRFVRHCYPGVDLRLDRKPHWVIKNPSFDSENLENWGEKYSDIQTLDEEYAPSC